MKKLHACTHFLTVMLVTWQRERRAEPDSLLPSCGCLCHLEKTMLIQTFAKLQPSQEPPRAQQP